MRYPLDNFYISQGYHTGHQALDLAAPENTHVKSPVSGTVVSVGLDPKYIGGLYVIVRAADGYEHYMGHHNKIHVSVGAKVKEGQHIADVGMTGKATGPHVHYQVRDPRGNLVPKSFYDKIGDTMEKVTLATARILAEGILGRDRNKVHAGDYDSDLKKNHVGKNLNNQYIMDLWQSKESKTAASKRISNEKEAKKVPDLTAQVKELTRVIDIKNKEIDRLNKELAECGGEDSENLNKLGEALRWLIVRLGLKG